MDVCKCIVPLRHGGTLNSRSAASPLVWLEEGIEIQATFQQTPRQRNSSRNESERMILFPQTNATEHSLPVFPDPIVEYLEHREQLLAPPTDKFGRPFCISKAGDTFCEEVDSYPE
ncbi:hypothetical protein TNCV_3256571 [Trichonephila clavipes]|nr:hypothetical protein TNCV_3256571 [Trichonephila clavipes]